MLEKLKHHVPESKKTHVHVHNCMFPLQTVRSEQIMIQIRNGVRSDVFVLALQVVCANVKLLWCPVGCLAWKPACELCVSFGWHQLAGIVCKRWRGPVGALPIPSFARLDLADVGAGGAQRAVPEPGEGLVASLSRKSYKDTFSPAYTVLYSSVRTRVGRITAARQPEGPWMFFLPFISPTAGLTFWINCHYCRFLFCFFSKKVL